MGTAVSRHFICADSVKYINWAYQNNRRNPAERYFQFKNTFSHERNYSTSFSFSASLYFYSCSDNETKSKEPTEHSKPEFADNGRIIDSLKNVYNCESINYENWDDKKTTDSCLTVCLISITKVPSGSNVDSTTDQLKGIASTIKKSLIKSQTYKSV